MCGISLSAGAIIAPVAQYLAIRQDERGGDGAGIAFNNSQGELIVLKGIAKEEYKGNNPFMKALKEKQDLINNSSIIPSLENLFKNFPFPQTDFILSHSRKATVGEVSEINAQPIVRDNIVLVHNGTIFMSESFKAMYNVENGENDSNFLASQMEAKNFKVLNEYSGTAALIWKYLDEPDHVYIYVGKSYGKIERTLWCLTDDKSFIYISSDSDPIAHATAMLPINEQHLDPFQIRTNVVHKVNLKTFTWESVVDVTRPEKFIQETKTSKPKEPKSGQFVYPPAINGTQYKNGRYYYKNKLIESKVTEKDGKKIAHPVNMGEEQAYFYDGILFKSRDSLEIFLNSIEETWVAANLIGLVVNPIPADLKQNGKSDFHYHHNEKTKLLNGKIYIPFTDYEIEYQHGCAISIHNLPVATAKKLTKNILNHAKSEVVQFTQGSTEQDDRFEMKLRYLHNWVERSVEQLPEKKEFFEKLKSIADAQTIN